MFNKRSPCGARYQPFVGDHYAFVTLGRKSDPDRHRVGYNKVIKLVDVTQFAKTKRVWLGAGPTWEVTFKRAAQKIKELQ